MQDAFEKMDQKITEISGSIIQWPFQNLHALWEMHKHVPKGLVVPSLQLYITSVSCCQCEITHFQQWHWFHHYSGSVLFTLKSESVYCLCKTFPHILYKVSRIWILVLLLCHICKKLLQVYYFFLYNKPHRSVCTRHDGEGMPLFGASAYPNRFRIPSFT